MKIFSEFFRVYILEPMGEKNPEFNFVCQDKSEWTELEIKNQVLSLYDTAADIKAFSDLKEFSNTVFSKNLFFPHNKRTWFHNIWHSDLPNQIHRSHQHWHRADFEEITPKDLTMLMTYLNEFHKQKKMCEDGKTHCLLTKQDQEAFLKAQKDFFEYQSRLGIKTVYAHLEDLKSSGIRSLLHGFLSTLWRLYLKPYLIYHRGYDKTKTEYFSKLLLSLADLCVSPTLMGAGLATVFREGLSFVLARMGCERQAEIVMLMASAIATASDPLSLMNLACSGGGTSFGSALAYRIIIELPKLKTEPAHEAPNQDRLFSKGQKEESVVQQPATSPSGLRHRRGGD